MNDLWDSLKEYLPLVEKLPFREREIIKLRYGIGAGQAYTLREVGRILKVTRERVRLSEESAVKKIKAWKEAGITE